MLKANIKNRQLIQYQDPAVLLDDNYIKNKLALNYIPTSNDDLSIFFDGIKQPQSSYVLADSNEIGYFIPIPNVNFATVNITTVPPYNLLAVELWNLQQDVPANFILKLSKIKYATQGVCKDVCLDVYVNGDRMTSGREYLEEILTNNSSPQMSSRIFFNIPLWESDEVLFKAYNPNIMDNNLTGTFDTPLATGATIIENN